MDTAHWSQGGLGLVKPMEELAAAPPPGNQTTSLGGSSCSVARQAPPQMVERRPRPQREQALNCPRCNSTNTKFCYYNNYSLSQPRYFCKACRRYWTEGGSLRNVPVGGGSRKNKRSYTSSNNTSNNISNKTATSTSSSLKLPSDHLNIPPLPISLQTTNFLEGQDLNLSFQSHTMPQFVEPPSNSTQFSGETSAMDLLRSKITGSGLNPFGSMSMTMAIQEGSAIYPSGFGLHQDLKPAGLSLDGGDHGGRRMLFPFESFRQVSEVGGSNEFAAQNNRGQPQPAGDHHPSAGFWNASW